VGGGVVDGDRAGRPRGQADSEYRGGGTAVALHDGHVADRQHRGVVVADGAHAGAVGDGGAAWCGEVEGEGLVPLDQGVTLDGDSDRLGRLAGAEAEHRVGLGRVVAGGDGGAVGGGVVDGDGA